MIVRNHHEGYASSWQSGRIWTSLCSNNNCLRMLLRLHHSPCTNEFSRTRAGGWNSGILLHRRIDVERESNLHDIRSHSKGCDQSNAGCMVAEMATGQPLFPGDSDIEQLALILACVGPLCASHAAIVASTPAIAGTRTTPPSLNDNRI